MLSILQAETEDDVATVRDLFREYQRWVNIDLGFQDFESEVANLPGPYAAPAGRLLLAKLGGAAVGCIALQPRNKDECEMKRLYVRAESQGKGVGRQLVDHLISEARRLGYRRIVLDTLPVMATAQRMYESLGFKEIQAYRYNPVPGARYLALDL
ncbi:MAG TPA: GNAT family N-acetyltransferase [Blastocatellia bacterium]|nr:GNAT family N-acetyltransferase [Blastocatellia bacterium]